MVVGGSGIGSSVVACGQWWCWLGLRLKREATSQDVTQLYCLLCVDSHMQDHMQSCCILFGHVLDECYCQLVIQIHRLASIQSMQIFDGECDGKYA